MEILIQIYFLGFRSNGCNNFNTLTARINVQINIQNCDTQFPSFRMIYQRVLHMGTTAVLCKNYTERISKTCGYDSELPVLQ